MGKLPFEEKTVEQLTEEMNNALRESENKPPMTIEEEIEYDAEAGYDYYEDDDIELTRELVHSTGELPPCLDYREGYFDDETSYVSELWYAYNTTLVTYYFSTYNMPNDKKMIEDYLIRVGKLKQGERHELGIMVIELEEEDIYSVTVAVGDDDETFCEAIL